MAPVNYATPGRTVHPACQEIGGAGVERKGARLDPSAVKSSKGIGEPPLVLGNTVLFAIRRAVAAARRDAGHDDWFDFPAPATVTRIQQACAVTRERLHL